MRLEEEAQLSPDGPGTQDRSRRRFCLTALVATIPLGLVWRLAPLHLPQFAYKYGGSALWAVAVYWLVAAVMVRQPPRVLGGLAAIVAFAVECLKRVYWRPLDQFRETLAGKLLLGRFFTWGAIVAYWVAIAAVVLLDSRWQRTGASVSRHRSTPGRVISG